jgi:hypothetical protein
VGGFGAGTYGLALGAGLADPAGRKLLSDVNLAAPLGLIPYSTLTDFRYVLPAPPAARPSSRPRSPRRSARPRPSEAQLDAADEPQPRFRLEHRPGRRRQPELAKASWGVMPGVKLQVGSGVGLDWKPTVTGPDGQTRRS